MIVDTILKILGENPIGYYETQDKWVAIIVILIEKDSFYLPWIFGAIPIVWLLMRKHRGKRISRLMIIISAIVVIALAALGFVMLDWLLELAFGLSYQRMYGDLFE